MAEMHFHQANNTLQAHLNLKVSLHKKKVKMNKTKIALLLESLSNEILWI